MGVRTDTNMNTLEKTKMNANMSAMNTHTGTDTSSDTPDTRTKPHNVRPGATSLVEENSSALANVEPCTATAIGVYSAAPSNVFRGLGLGGNVHTESGDLPEIVGHIVYHFSDGGRGLRLSRQAGS